MRTCKTVADLPDTDYRHHPYVEPTLPPENKERADILFGLAGRKGVFPYEHIKSGEELNEANLPPKESFFSKLRGEGISDEEYAHAQNVCSEFNMTTMWDYQDLYLITDVLLLADILVNFKKTCLESYNIDPLHSFTLPGFAWEAALKMTDVELDLISDPDMYLFFEQGIRGGVSVISQRHVESNVPGSSTYDPSKKSSHLLYVDANNQYGWAMSSMLPTKNLKWETDVDLQRDVIDRPDDAPRGCVLEVDLSYDEELHDAHNDYPAAPESFFSNGRYAI